MLSTLADFVPVEHRTAPTPELGSDRYVMPCKGWQTMRVFRASAVTTVVVVLFTGCVWVRGGGPSKADAVEWARVTSLEVIDAIEVGSEPLWANEREGVCTSIDHSFDNWASWVISTDYALDPSERLPVLDRVTESFVQRDGWIVAGDETGEILPASQSQFTRSLHPAPSHGDQGAQVTVTPEGTRVDVTVRSACYIVP